MQVPLLHPKGGSGNLPLLPWEALPVGSQEDDSESDVDDEQEEVVSEIRSRAMEAKSRRKTSFNTDSFSWIFSPKTGELFLTLREDQKNEENTNGKEDGKEEDFFSVGTCFSRCSSTRSSSGAFLSVRTNFSRSSSLGSVDRHDFKSFLVQEFWQGFEWEELRRRAIIQEFRNCEGWPFGLYRKALLLPPLPKCPSESWTWRRKGGRLVELP
ncbi:hypothetical protein NMG60_11024258 [Bertholletia excelsa]